MSALIAAATVAACGGGGDSGTEPTPAISIALSSSALSVTQGTNGTVTANLTRSGGFTGNVAITVEGLPGTVTYTSAPATIAGGASSAVITFDVAGAATPGVINATVKATGTGVSAVTAPLAITVVAAPAQSYSLGVANPTVTATQGATATQTVNITRTGGFAGAVALTASGLPTGVTAAFDPQSPAGNSSTLTLTAAANAATGNASVTVKGTATGQADKTATFQLTVNAASASGFTLASNPATLTIQQGTGGTSTVTITRTGGFAGAVTLTATGMPNGVTAVFDPTAPTTNSSTLTLTASATAATGAATVTIHGNATGLTEQTTTVALTVNPAAGGSGNTSFEFCTVDQTPIWLAMQDGANGTWTRVNPSASGTKFQFNITQAKAGVAYVTSTTSAGVASASGSLAVRLAGYLQREMLLRNRPTRASAYAARSLATGFGLTILYGSQAELNGRGANLCLPGSGKTVNGTVAGVNSAQAQSASISLGPSSTSAAPAGTFQLTDVPDGALDLVAARSTTNTTTLSTAVDKVIIRRGVNAGNNSTLPVLDFGSSEAFDPVQGNLTIANLGTDVATVFTSYFTAAGSGAAGATVGASVLPSAGPFTYYGVPASKQIAGDLHLALAIAFPNLTTLDQERIAALYFKDPTDRTVTLGAALPAQTVSAAATAPYVRFRATGPIPADYGKLLDLEFRQSSAARSVTILASESYLAGAANYDITVPDFSGVAGWDNNWGPKTGSETEWRVSTYGFTGIGLGSLTPVDGATFKGAGRSGTITP
jgi:hypothetical protein